MNLKSIKLAGFKSFVDPTVLPLPGRLTAIVGPNGCGKSNIVDAIRWVIGESSAKQLRGEHLADVIFNGSAQRKPVGQAAVELIFDNTQGRCGGEYAQYNEISIRRELTRDGQSQFYLNGARCRRRDVTDLFLGTGLGPHSYAIIEQGVISKLVEGKPEDIRVYLEEAAGTSKYRERRRETENRLKHTRENLDRLNDLRVEMEKQLEHLQRQAAAAERYKTLKQEQRLVKAQCHALQCKTLDQEYTQQQLLLSEQTTQLEAKIAECRHIELFLEQQREKQAQANEAFNTVQARFYQVGAEVARQEQDILHIQTQSRQLADDLAAMETSWQEAEQHLLENRKQIETLTLALESLLPETEQAVAASEQSAITLQQAESQRMEAQTEWERLQAEAAKAMRQLDVEQTRLHHLGQKIQGLTERQTQVTTQREQLHLDQLPQDIQQLSEQTGALKAQLDTHQNTLTELNPVISQQQNLLREAQGKRDQLRQALYQLSNQKASLEALQQAALGKQNVKATEWLKKQGWGEKPRLLEALEVEKGWETAAETVLAPYLEAVCTDQIEDLRTAADQFTEGRLSVFYAGSTTTTSTLQKAEMLRAKIQARWSLNALLDGVYIADDVASALSLLPSLTAQESVVTKSGLWFGASWLRVSYVRDETSGVLQRKQALQEIDATIAEQERQIAAQEKQLQDSQETLTRLDQERDAKQQTFRTLSAQYNALHAEFSSKQARHEQLQQRARMLEEDLQKLQAQQAEALVEKDAAQQAYEAATVEKQQFDAKKAAWQENKKAQEDAFQQCRSQANQDKQRADACQVRLSTTQSQLDYLRQNSAREEKQIGHLRSRREDLLARQTEIQRPLPELKEKLENLLQERVTAENLLTQEKQKLSHLEADFREQEKNRAQFEKDASGLRESMEKIRIQQSTIKAHCENHLAQIAEAEYQLETLLQEMPEGAEENLWQENLTRIENRIQRLGAINLAAIEEYQSMSERKIYLDNQDKDLREAMETLENAIRKIDRESRTRLRETFDSANAQFKTLFTRMFEGGNAELEWVGDEVLSAGVVIRAQPPGKRNTLLYLLSGGEKALTAIALVFALFQLNPAPFCILDEVDAPLDEANVGRFSRLVKSMSETVQFLFVSHNKSTIQMAQQMIGVTMQEPGVSRMVSVDVEQAITLAEVA